VVPIKAGRIALTGLDAIFETWSPDNPEETLEKSSKML
jgi:hypothetical protein